MLVRPLSTVDNTRDYTRVSHSIQRSNYNITLLSSRLHYSKAGLESHVSQQYLAWQHDTVASGSSTRRVSVEKLYVDAQQYLRMNSLEADDNLVLQ